MAKNIQQIVSEALASTRRDYINEAVNQLLSEDINAGDTVASVHDGEAMPYQGVTGKCKGPSSKGSGWVDVSYADGTVVPMQSSLLIKV